MNLEAIKLSQLRCLVAVAKSGNFSEAALNLSVSQSAVSHAIASLEDELGVVLLSRGRHGATLTPIGEQVVCHAQEVLRLIEVIGKEASLSKGLEGGQVRISSVRSAATHLLPEVIAKFRQRYPGISVTIMEHRGDDRIEQALREGRADVGIICLPPSPDLQTWDLLRDEYIALLPPDAKVPNNQLTWDHLATYPLIMPPHSDYCAVLVRVHLTGLQQPVNAAYEIREDSTIVSMVMQGLGATIIARLAAEPLPPDVQIYRLPVPLERVIRAAVFAEALHPPAVYAFLDTLKEVSQVRNMINLRVNGHHESRSPQVIPIAFPRGGGEARQLQ
ncbi:MAG: LysR family transcriptional regulator [Cyanobacteria bacterium RU_5_0]|nr:LysR family transcriptional regulator [Cyanobacteria bacterium RU_5_0]